MKHHLLSDENESFKTKIIAGGERGQLVEQSSKAGERGWAPSPAEPMWMIGLGTQLHGSSVVLGGRLQRLGCG